MRLACLLLLAVSASALAQEKPAEKPAEKPKVEVVQEYGAYYSSIGLYIPIGDDLPDGGRLDEGDVYRQLFQRSYRPNVIALEVSVYPMPILGVWLRKEHPGFYDISPSVIQAVTAGFQEPWAVSAFFGSQMKFTRPGEGERDANRGYVGYLLSAGTKHIKNNVQIDDNWIELEAKMKGERVFKEDRLDWSFRIGGKLNGNHDIANTIYLGLRRSNLDFKRTFLSFLDNSRIDLFTEFGGDGSLLRQEVIFGKKFPIESRRMAWELDFGVIYERAAKYSGELAPLARNSLTVVFRPNLVF